MYQYMHAGVLEGSCICVQAEKREEDTGVFPHHSPLSPLEAGSLSWHLKLALSGGS